MTIDPDNDANQHDHANELVKQLRERACPAGKPWTGDVPEEDHGHTDCWLHLQSAREIERLHLLISEWADTSDADNEAWQTNPPIVDRDATYAAMRKAILALRQEVGR